nr:MAG TPA: hypothetical protein [Caudoviricetes sp.]
MEKALAFDSNTEGVRRSEEEIKKYIRESDEVSLSWIKEALSREENRREARRMESWMKSGRNEEDEDILTNEIILETMNG